MYYNPDSDRLDFDTNISVQHIKEFFRQNNSGPFFSMFETGLGGNRFDLIRVDPYRQYVRIFEFKSGRSDFTSDKKWQKYLKYCHTFTFVCPREAIQKNDLPNGIGLMWVYKWTHKQWPDNWKLSAEWIKKPKAKDVDIETLLRLAFMMLHRVPWRKKDVF